MLLDWISSRYTCAVTISVSREIDLEARDTEGVGETCALAAGEAAKDHCGETDRC
jgi:hypothetical protein